MELGGIIAGAMAGGGQAIQQNAQGQLEQQREEALQRLENEFSMGVVEYEQNRADQRARAEAKSEAALAEDEYRRDLGRMEFEKSLEDQGSNSERFDDMYERAKARTDRDFEGRVDVASSPMAAGEFEAPQYNSLLADNLRREAAAVEDDALRQRLNRQADAIESGSGSQSGEITMPPLNSFSE